MSENETNVKGMFISRDLWLALSQLEPLELWDVLNSYSEFMAGYNNYESLFDSLHGGSRAMFMLLTDFGKREV